MKIKKISAVVLVLCLIISLFTGCGEEKKQAKQAMADYLNHIIASEYSEAYALLSDFDKGNISEEEFKTWREQAAKIMKVKSFTIDSKVDVFKDYKYSGTEFGNVYGLKVDSKQELLIPDVELGDYDKETYRIMVLQQGDEYKVLLLLTDLNETIAKYRAYIDKLK